MTKYTPMIEQYLRIREEAKDALLFFRLGDFYELFFEDAVKASQLLEITLTGRDAGTDERIPMCGVPYHSAEQYIMKLVNQGYKVAICEQVEDPAEAKGVVKREIVRIVTPGTAMEEKSLGSSRNNFIVSLAHTSEGYGLTACDLSTGELYQTELGNDLAPLLDEAFVYQPSEIVTGARLKETVQQMLARMNINIYMTVWQWSGTDEAIHRHLPDEDPDKLGEPSRVSLSQLLEYLEETQKRVMPHLTRVQVYEANQFMTLDPYTRRNLELTETVRDRTKKGSLYGLLDHTVTAMGSRMLKRWINKPLMSRRLIEERHEAVESLLQQWMAREELRNRLKKVYDMERLVGRISFGTANARDLTALKASLSQVPELIHICGQTGSKTLNQLTKNLDPCSDVLAWIDAALIDDPPISVKEGGMIKPGYHNHLDQLREASSNGKRWIAELEQREREETGIKNLKVGFNKVFGYYIEVTRANAALVPEGRYERKQTLANAERYITPELKEKEALILEAEEKMFDLEYELFADLRSKVAGEVSRLQRLADVISSLDVYQSFATAASENRYCRPKMTEQYELIIERGRHPVVEDVIDQGSFIDNDTYFRDGQRMYLITGPNMAGKSTYMRQAALICIMAQIGSFVPADRAVLPVIDRIFTRIGAADDLIGGQSTFMVEMMDIQVMTAHATKRSLVIIDELGRGTSTTEGMAIAQAVIEYLHDEVGCKTLVSTHFHELARLEGELQHLRNYSMAVKESGDEVTFLRKLIAGAASTSYGIYCAQLAGLPETIIRRSYELLQQMEHPSAADSASREVAAAAAANAEDAAACDAEGHVVQLSLFDDPSQHEAAAKPSNLKEHEKQVIEAIRKTDLLNITPLQAMQLMNEWKQKLLNGG